MAKDSVSNPDLSPRPEDAGRIPPAEQSGPAIISLLQQAADVARRNEERAKAMASQLAGQVDTLERENSSLQQQVHDFQERAVRAEQWLLHIYDEIHVKLIEQSPSITADAPVDPRPLLPDPIRALRTA